MEQSARAQPPAWHWSVCEAPARDAGTAAPPQDGWIAIPGPMTAAAALRATGCWSLDDAPRDFDASDWWFRARFDVADPASRLLGLDGVATLSEVSLNGTALGTCDSMFLAQRYDVGHLLRPAGNELLVRCRALAPELARRRPRPRWRAPMVPQQQLRWLRTTLLGRTPGWSPPAAPVGPWRDVWLGAAAPVDCTLTARLVDGTGLVDCDAVLDAQAEAAQLVLECEGRRFAQPLARAGSRWHATLQVPRPALWWPHTHGEPALHAARLEVQRRDGSTHVEPLRPVGFRTVEADTRDGRFLLRINGERVFCRGAVWSPLDPVGLRATPEATHAAVAQACAAGMNMLRIAGTTVPEEDAFYAACDALGMLVWQDFLFANLDYPGEDAGFAALAAEEARQLLQRIGGRACLAVLCGNSEVEQQAAMWGATREHWQPRLFHATLAEAARAHAPGVPYWPSSAHGGAFPHQADAGTTSYYGVGAYLRPLEDARRADPSFVTECLAFANIPDDAALARLPGGLATRAHHPQWKARSPRDLGAGWDFDDVRDHYLGLLFGLDPHRLRQSDHARYLALGRLATGHAMAAAFAEWRRPASRCGGALVLMLRDLWAGAGWGLVDDAGGPKPCWHLLRPALQPVALFLTDEGGNGLAAHAVNDTAAPLDTTLEVTAWRGGEVRVAAGSLPLHVPARGGTTTPCAALFDHVVDLGHAWRFGPPACELVVATLRDGAGRALAQAFHFPTGLPATQTPDVGLRAAVERLDAGRARLHVETRAFAFGVHVDAPGWRADSDHLHLPPQGRATLLLQGAGPLRGSVRAVNALAEAAFDAGADTP